MGKGRPWLRLLLGLAVVAFFMWFLQGQWGELRRLVAGLAPDWPLLALASCSIGAGYAVLVAAWRALIATFGSRLDLLDAVRIWFVSSLGKYVPFKLAAIGAMAVLARDAGTSAIAATGSAIVMQLVNIAAGFVVIAAIGAGDLGAQQPALRAVAITMLVATPLAILFGPALLRGCVTTASRLLRRELPMPDGVTRATLLWVTLANIGSWLCYGVGFWLFAQALLGRAPGSLASATAVWAASYLAGFLALPAPGGVGVREAVLTALLVSLRLASPADAALLAAASRVWLTVLEIVPGLGFIPGTIRRRSTTDLPDGPTP